MTYDDWKTETPEEEDYRLSNRLLKARGRAEWMEEHADYLLEDRLESRKRDADD